MINFQITVKYEVSVLTLRNWRFPPQGLCNIQDDVLNNPIITDKSFQQKQELWFLGSEHSYENFQKMHYSNLGILSKILTTSQSNHNYENNQIFEMNT